MEHQVRPSAGARRRVRRKGRGDGSGRGSYSGKGIKGQKSRSGSGARKGPAFEGGQLPLVKRLPKQRGFTNIFKREYALVNLGSLGLFPEGVTVTPQALVEAGLVKGYRLPVKVLGTGELHHPLTVAAHKFSAGARKKIEEAGGKVEELGA